MCRGRLSEPELSIEHRHDGDRPLLVVAGEIDHVTADQFRAAVDRALEEHARIELDLRGVSFMDSGGLAVLIAAHQRVGQNREAVVVRTSSPMILRLLEISGVGPLIDVRDEAIDGDQRAELRSSAE
jgi:anti-sigma B factor antagonist